MDKNIENRPEELRISTKVFFFLCIILLVILGISIVCGANGLIDPYVGVAIASLSFIGFIILVMIAKNQDEESRKNL